MPDPIESWVQDGTPQAEPVTTETPTAEPVPAPEPAAAPEPAEQPRDAVGRWASQKDEPAAEPAAEAPATEAQQATAEAVAEKTGAEAPAPGSSAQEVQEFIEAQLGEETFQIPKGVRLPLKVQGKTEYAPLDELLSGGMRERDYRLKTGEVGTQRRELERERREFLTERAKIEARAKILEEQEAELKEAMTDPDKWESYQEHLRQYQANPVYRKNVDAALRQRETDAELETYRQRDHVEQVETGVQQVQGWVNDLAEEYDGVDPQRVLNLYAAQLRAGQTTLDPSAVRAIFKSEADYLSKSVTPLQQQLADLKAQVEALSASKAAEKHNQTTTHAVDRAKAPRVSTGGNPPAPAPAPKGPKFGMNELPDRVSAWANRRE